MRKHLTYANAAATLALVFAMTGGAMAAKHYLIESTSQISPKVLKKLRGRTGNSGATGKTGVSGAPGATGAAGPPGPPGPFPGTLPSGKTLTGAWVVGGTGSKVAGQTALSFSYPLSARPVVHIIRSGAPTPAGCSGNVEHPGAAPGNLCVFEGFNENVRPEGPGDYDPASEGVNNESAFTGIVVYSKGAGTEEFTDSGTWAVTGL